MSKWRFPEWCYVTVPAPWHFWDLARVRYALLAFGAVLCAWLVCLPASAADLDEGWAALRGGDYAKALALASEVRQAERSNEQAWRLEAESLLRLGRYDEAFSRLDRARSAVRFSIRLRLLAREAALLSDREHAVDELMQEVAFLAANTPGYLRDSDFRPALGEAALLLGVEPRLVLENFFRPAMQDPDHPSREAFLAAGKLALAKNDYAVASRTFQEALKTYPTDADFWWGMAASFLNGDRAKLVEYATAALTHNSNHVPARLLLAEHRIDTEDLSGADEELSRAQAINPHQPETLALCAVIAHLRNKPDDANGLRARALATWKNNPQVDHLIGRKLSQKYRFSEGAEAQRRALVLDAKFTPARIQLAQDLLRLARDEEGWTLAREAHAQDPYDVTAYNLTVLQDQLKNFTTLSNEHFRLRMSRKEADIYGERALALLERARVQLVEKYGVVLDQPVTVEIYPDPKDFAVRTFGMPGRPGYLGVCFGPVFTVNSPATQRANWEAVLWHEFCHVVTLTLTRNRMPRWLSEGISVYEERLAAGNWGERMTPDYRQRILSGKMQPVSGMSAAFLQAETNQDVLFAYFQSSLVVQFMAETYGFPALKALLAGLRDGTDINEALARHVAPLDELERRFVPFAKAEAQRLGGGYDLSAAPDGVAGVIARLNPRNLPAQIEEIQSLIENKRWADAKVRLEELTRKTGYMPGENSPHRLLATVFAALGDDAAEKEAWTVVAEHEDDALEAVQRLLELSQTGNDAVGVERWSHAWLAINPLAAPPWRALLEVSENQSHRAEAVAAGRVLLLLDQTDVASLHYRIAKQLREFDRSAARRHVLLALAEAPRFRAAYDLLHELAPAQGGSP